VLKKDITYEDYDGNTQTETFWFHLSKAELIEYDMNTDGGLKGLGERLIAADNGGDILKEFRNLILMTYGIREGGSFSKSPQAREAFASSEPFSELLMELATDPDKAAEFFNGIVPKSLADQVAKLEVAPDRSSWGKTGPEEATETANIFAQPAGTPERPRTLTREEILEMDHDELKSGLATGRYLIGGNEPHTGSVLDQS
jgi:hypothetical protein